MFEKIPSFKDLLLYFLPGVLTVFFLSLLIAKYSNNYGTNLNFLRNADGFQIIIILIPLIIGFFISQIQIIFFAKGLRRYVKSDSLLAAVNISLRNEIIDKFKTTFSSVNFTDDQISNELFIVELCYTFLLENSKTETIAIIDRYKYISNFILVLPVPVLISLVYLTLQFYTADLSWWIFSGLALSYVTYLLLTFFLWRNFRKGWSSQIFLTFYVLR